MTNNPFINAEQAYKTGFDFSPWGGIDGFLAASKTSAIGNHSALKRLVPDLAHAVDMTAVAIASLPFDILDEAGEVADTSADWQNKLGGMPNPQSLLYKVASSLCGGSAYVIPHRTPKMVFDLQYAAPHTIQPHIEMDGLKWFDRASDQGSVEKFTPKDLLYFWLPDSDIEIGPALNHPLGNAALDAMLVWAMKSTLKQYGDRGFVPITLLGSEGMPSPAERERSEAFFDRLLKGGFDVLAKIVNLGKLSIIRVGAGMDELKQSYLEIRRDAKESIADSFGIPPALFMSDNAFASEFVNLRQHWYSASRFVSIYQTIQETFSDQLFAQYGYSMRFALETLDIFQDDEGKKAESLSQFVTAVTTDPAVAQLGMGILGYDLTAEQEKMMKDILKAKEEEKAKLDEQMAAQAEAAAKPPAGETKPAAKPLAKALDLTAEELKDLALWYSKAKAWHLKSKGNAVDWENKHLREDVAAPIRLKLAAAKNEYDIMQAFELHETETPAPEYKTAEIAAIIELAKSLDNFTAKSILAPPAPPLPAPNYTVNLTAQMPAQGEPSVTFSPIIQPSEVAVQVTNEVQPAAVKVTNEVNVPEQPAAVVNVELPPEKKKKIKLDRSGNGTITGMHEE